MIPEKTSKSNIKIPENSMKNNQLESCDYGGDKFYIIPDMIAADVYTNFENKGFKIDKQIENDHTSIYCDLSLSNAKFSLIVTGCAPDQLISIKATAIDYSGNNQKDIEDFFEYVATLQYKSSNPEMARKWVVENINNSGAKTTIGSVTFYIDFKTTNSKLLRMEIEI